MSEVVGEAVIKVKTDESGVDIDGAGSRAGKGYSKGFLGGIKGLALGIGGVLAAAGTVNFFKDSIAEARESQKVGAVSAQIIKATGGAANVTAEQLGKLTTSISNATGQDDELIQSGANLLLTFKNVRNEAGKNADIFDRATAASVDLAAAGFGSVESGAKGLGKALNDPLKGISALSRAGVTFTEGQKAQIAGFVESGDILSAQKIILGEVESQVGGVAAASATAGEKASVAFGNFKEAVGTALLPVLDTLANFFVTSIVPALYDALDAASSLGPAFGMVGDFISSAFGGSNGSAVSGFFASLQAAAAGVLPVLADLFTGTVLPAVLQLASALQDGLGQVLPVMAATFTGTVLPALTAVAGYLVANVLPIFSQVVGIIVTSVIPTVVALATFFYGTLYPALIQIVTAVVQNLKPVLDQLVATFRDQILPTLQQVIDQIRTQLIPALEPLVMVVVQVIGFLLKLAATILGFVLPPLIRLAGFILANVLPAVISIITFIAKLVSGLISLGGAIGSAVATFVKFYASLVTGVAGAVSDVVSAISGLPGKVLGFVGKMVSAGAGLIGGLLSGMKNAASGVGGIISGVASGVLDAVRSAVNSVIDQFNSAIPNSLGAGPLSVDLPDNPIPHLARGALSFGGGLAVVGEQGRELVSLPAGARVRDHNDTERLLGSDDVVALLQQMLAALLAGQDRPNVTAVLPSGDPEAAAMALLNRLVTV